MTMEARMCGPHAVRNRLLLAMPAAVFERLRPKLVHVNLTRGQVLMRAGSDIAHHHFINGGNAARSMTMRDGRAVGIHGLGIDGTDEPDALFGSSRATLDTVIHVGGDGFRVSHSALRAEVERDEGFSALMRRYSQFVIERIVQNVACVRLHSLEERLCRLLLLSLDDAGSDTFKVTHQFLSVRLSVQRPGVSIAAESLKRAGLIRYSRASMTLVDRTGLEKRSCECYAAVRDAYANVFEDDRPTVGRAHASRSR